MYLERLIEAFSSLPGISRRLARNIVLNFVFKDDLLNALKDSFEEAVHRKKVCPGCGFLMDEKGCPICDDPERERSSICVVPDPLTLYVFEENSLWNGLYFVLGGLVDPSSGIAPSDLRINDLVLFVKRIIEDTERKKIEVCFAFDSTVEGDITVRLLLDALKEVSAERLVLTKLAPLPSGARVSSLDVEILKSAFKNRKRLDE